MSEMEVKHLDSMLEAVVDDLANKIGDAVDTAIDANDSVREIRGLLNQIVGLLQDLKDR